MWSFKYCRKRLLVLFLPLNSSTFCIIHRSKVNPYASKHFLLERLLSFDGMGNDKTHSLNSFCPYCHADHLHFHSQIHLAISLKHIKLYFGSREETTASCIFSLLIPAVDFSTWPAVSCDNLPSSEQRTL